MKEKENGVLIEKTEKGVGIRFFLKNELFKNFPSVLYALNWDDDLSEEQKENMICSDPALRDEAKLRELIGQYIQYCPLGRRKGIEFWSPCEELLKLKLSVGGKILIDFESSTPVNGPSNSFLVSVDDVINLEDVDNRFDTWRFKADVHVEVVVKG